MLQLLGLQPQCLIQPQRTKLSLSTCTYLSNLDDEEKCSRGGVGEEVVSAGHAREASRLGHREISLLIQQASHIRHQRVG